MNPKWDKRFMDLADLVSGWSKDPSTKVGSVIVDNEKNIRGVGFNGLPRGVDDTDERHERPIKYKFISHAEENSILNAARLGTILHGCTLYVNVGCICPDCARAIIQSGISAVKYREPSKDIKSRWQEDMEISITMMKEAGIEIQELPIQEKELESWKLNS